MVLILSDISCLSLPAATLPHMWVVEWSVVVQ